MRAVFHLVASADWPTDGIYRPPSLQAEGFVHLSFADQVAGSADRHFADTPELLCVELDTDLLTAPVWVEDSYGSGTAHPHLYGPVPVSAAVRVEPMRRDAGGRWLSPPTAAGDDASPGR